MSRSSAARDRCARRRGCARPFAGTDRSLRGSKSVTGPGQDTGRVRGTGTGDAFHSPHCKCLFACLLSGQQTTRRGNDAVAPWLSPPLRVRCYGASVDTRDLGRGWWVREDRADPSSLTPRLTHTTGSWWFHVQMAFHFLMRNFYLLRGVHEEFLISIFHMRNSRPTVPPCTSLSHSLVFSLWTFCGLAFL